MCALSTIGLAFFFDNLKKEDGDVIKHAEDEHQVGYLICKRDLEFLEPVLR